MRVTGKKLCPHRAVAIAVSHMDKFKRFIITVFFIKGKPRVVPRCSGADQEWSKKGHDSFSLAGKLCGRLSVLSGSRKYPYPPPPTATEIPRGGGTNRRQFPRGWGVASRDFFPGGLSKISELLINNNFSLERPFSYFTLNRCFKTSVNVCFGHFLSTVGSMLFPRLTR